MGSTILVRNRNILLRLSVPVAVGVGMGWAVIPITMQNIGDLIWSYEKKFPVVADAHSRTQDAVTHFVQTGIAHSKMGAAMLEEKIGDARKSVEDWVKKGR
jgi:organizing structure protein 2